MRQQRILCEASSNGNRLVLKLVAWCVWILIENGVENGMALLDEGGSYPLEFP